MLPSNWLLGQSGVHDQSKSRGSQCNLRNPKYSFSPQPFYGGKRNRISAEVFGPPPSKKSIATVTGEWNGSMHIKMANSSQSNPLPFIDTKTMPIIKKQVKPIAQQSEYESRNLWKKVTAALKHQDVHEATAAKFAIEQNQRDLVKRREEEGLEWENRVSNQGNSVSF